MGFLTPTRAGRGSPCPDHIRRGLYKFVAMDGQVNGQGFILGSQAECCHGYCIGPFTGWGGGGLLRGRSLIPGSWWPFPAVGTSCQAWRGRGRRGGPSWPSKVRLTPATIILCYFFYKFSLYLGISLKKFSRQTSQRCFYFRIS